MAVVINEFEVVPAEPRQATAEAAPAARDQKHRDPVRDLDLELRRRARRSVRARGV